MIQATVIADSISPAGKRLTSIQITAHRWILAEINTHRMLSRNYRSSRAVPVKTLLKEVRENPAMPVAWLKNKPGMQAGEPMTEAEIKEAERVWLIASNDAARYAEHLGGLLHKQWANRLLEPFMFTHGIITATEWDNLWGLRCHPDAQPEFQALAKAMREAYLASKPALLQPGEWHLPYIDDEDRELIGRKGGKKKVSAARCARVSYKVFDADRKPTVEEDLELADRLSKSGHWSPFEHQATPDYWENPAPEVSPIDFGWQRPEQHGNFVGWRQYRKTFANESVAPLVE